MLTIHITSLQALSLLLGLSESEVEHVTSQVECSQRIQHADRPPGRVRFESDSVSHISGFLGCFTCTPHVAEAEGNQAGGGTISVVKDLSEDRKRQLGISSLIVQKSSYVYILL